MLNLTYRMLPARKQSRVLCSCVAVILSRHNLALRTVSLNKFRSVSSSMDRPKVFVTRRVPEDGINLLRKFCEVTQWDSDDAIPRSELIKGIKDVDGLFCLLTDKVDEEVLDSAG